MKATEQAFEQALCGVALLVAIVGASVIAYHFAGGLGILGVVSVYCVYRAT